jgi:hypothetical protein
MRPSSDISMSFRPGETERFCFVARASAGNNNIVAPIIAAMVPTSQLHWDVRLPIFLRLPLHGCKVRVLDLSQSAASPGAAELP